MHLPDLTGVQFPAGLAIGLHPTWEHAELSVVASALAHGSNTVHGSPLGILVRPVGHT